MARAFAWVRPWIAWRSAGQTPAGATVRASSAVSFDRSTSFIGHDGYAEVGGASRESVIKCGDCRAVLLRGV